MNINHGSGSSIDKAEDKVEKERNIKIPCIYKEKPCNEVFLFFFIIKDKIDLLWLVEDLFVNYLWLFYLTKNEFLHKGT
jgi:hypothetical protein